jgi:ABC-type enterochelin transport system permease subunit
MVTIMPEFQLDFRTTGGAMNGWRIANWGMLLLFLFAVAVQYNDPDPIRWMAVYGLAAAACLLALKGRLPRLPTALLAAVALAWAGTLAARVVGKQPLIDSEEGREMLGLLLVFLWTGVLAWRSRPGRVAPTPP